MIDLWRIVAVAALILAILFAALGWPWAAAVSGMVAGTYAGALAVVCLLNLVKSPLIQQIDDRQPASGAEGHALEQPGSQALAVLNSSVQDLHELGRRLRREWDGV